MSFEEKAMWEVCGGWVPRPRPREGNLDICLPHLLSYLKTEIPLVLYGPHVRKYYFQHLLCFYFFLTRRQKA